MKKPYKTPNYACKRRPITIYKLTNGKDTYVGMTIQPLATRLKQHKYDAATKKVCPGLPSALRALHRKLRIDGDNFKMVKIKTMNASYYEAHQVELAMQKKYATLV